MVKKFVSIPPALPPSRPSCFSSPPPLTPVFLPRRAFPRVWPRFGKAAGRKQAPESRDLGRAMGPVPFCAARPIVLRLARPNRESGAFGLTAAKSFAFRCAFQASRCGTSFAVDCPCLSSPPPNSSESAASAFVFSLAFKLRVGLCFPFLHLTFPFASLICFAPHAFETRAVLGGGRLRIRLL